MYPTLFNSVQVKFFTLRRLWWSELNMQTCFENGATGAIRNCNENAQITAISEDIKLLKKSWIHELDTRRVPAKMKFQYRWHRPSDFNQTDWAQA